MTNTSAFPQGGGKDQKDTLRLGLGVLYTMGMITVWMLLLVGFHLVTDKMIGR